MKRLWLYISVVVMLVGASVAQVPTSNHVVLVVEENHGYSSVIGNSQMPYLNSLASKYGLATRYYANTHPSIGNYFEIVTGQILTNNDAQTPATFPVSADNIVRRLMTAGKTWKTYAEDLPSVGYTGGDTGNYAVRHNPFAYLTDVQNSSTEKLNLVPFTHFATDMANGQLPDFSYIVPNLNNDAHNGTLQQADAWLQKNIAPLLATASFQRDGILIITFDESTSTDTADGGGHIATVVIGPKAKLGYKSATVYQHQSLLGTILTALEASGFPGAAASAPAMSDLFVSTTASSSTASTTASTTTQTTSGVTITSPSAGAAVSSPVQVKASARSGNSAAPITAMRIYADNASVYTVNAASISTSLTLSAGTHTLTIVAWDSTGKAYTRSVTITVSSATGGVTITSPTSGATTSSPVSFKASASSGSSAYPITAMRLYVDGASMYTVNAASLNTSLQLAAGGHNVTVVAWDASGKSYTKGVNITVSSTASAGGVTISSPVSGATVSSPVQFTASARANSGHNITAMRIYVDNVAAYTVNSAALNTSLNLASGSHSIIIQAWDNAGAVYKSAENISVAAPATSVSHSATLKWNASTSANVVGYRLYRGTQSGGPYTQIGSSSASVTSYTDSKVVAGATYYYVATAVSGTGGESGYSAPVTAVIPAP